MIKTLKENKQLNEFNALMYLKSGDPIQVEVVKQRKSDGKWFVVQKDWETGIGDPKKGFWVNEDEFEALEDFVESKDGRLQLKEGMRFNFEIFYMKKGTYDIHEIFDIVEEIRTELFNQTRIIVLDVNKAGAELADFDKTVDSWIEAGATAVKSYGTEVIPVWTNRAADKVWKKAKDRGLVR